MPFYEYECSNCKFYTEVMQKISDAPLTKCPSCGKKTMKKLVSAPVFRLKGAGWYETDFKSDKEGKRNLAGADKDDSGAKADSDAAESKGSESAKSESKPDSAAEAPKKADKAQPTPSTGPSTGKTASSSESSGSRRSASRAARPAARGAAPKGKASKARSTPRTKSAGRKKAGR
jgi:putative FmdB family regulatory protein